MPSKKKKYNARFPAGRIKKIMQTDEEVGKVAQAVPVIISRTLELFVESLLTKSMQITQSRNAKTLTPSHMKQCILSESRFDFLKDLVKNIPDASAQEDSENNALFEASLKTEEAPQSSAVKSEPSPTIYTEQGPSRTPVIQYGPKVAESKKISFSVSNLLDEEVKPERTAPISFAVNAAPFNESANCDNIPPLIPIAHHDNKERVPAAPMLATKGAPFSESVSCDNAPPLIPIAHHDYSQSTEDNLCIDEDYDN